MDPSSPNVTSLLAELAGGNQDAAAELFPLVYEELRRIAARCSRHERTDHTLEPTALVHEAYLKLVGQRDAHWHNRAHFFAIASQIMRRVLVDYARGQLRAKRGGRQLKVPLWDGALASSDRTEELLAIHESLSRLEKLDARQSRIVELRYFGGLTVEEVAAVLRVSSKTVKREWSVAKAWLFGDLKERHGELRVGESKDAV